MSNKYETYEQYWSQVQRTATIELEETREHAEDEGIEVEDLPAVSSEYAVENSSIVNNYPRSIICHTDQGFEGEGRMRFLENREFEDNAPSQMLHALASAAYFNDVKEAIDRILEARDDLGECVNLIDDDAPIYSEGVTFEYEYEKGLSDPEVLTYTLESVDSLGGEWFMLDPDGEHFETISPRVMVEDAAVPEQKLKLKLDNLCAKRERERDSENANE